MSQGWRNESERHSLSRLGIKNKENIITDTQTTYILDRVGYKIIRPEDYKQITWILSNGSLIGGLVDKDNAMYGRGHEHISQLYNPNLDDSKLEENSINKFIREGNIRINASQNNLMIEFTQIPTEKQKQALRNVIIHMLNDSDLEHYTDSQVDVTIEGLVTKNIARTDGVGKSVKISVFGKSDIGKVMNAFEPIHQATEQRYKDYGE